VVLEIIILYYEKFNWYAAFANPEIYCLLETEDYYYAIRLKGNNILHGLIEHLLKVIEAKPRENRGGGGYGGGGGG